MTMTHQEHKQVHISLLENLRNVADALGGNRQEINVMHLMEYCSNNSDIESRCMLDELVADFISQTDHLPSRTSVSDLEQWAKEQAKNPTASKSA